MLPAYKLDGVPGFSKNPFLASSEANDLVDFFMLDSLKAKLAERLKEQLRPFALKFQSNEGSPNTEIFISTFGSEVDGLDFWDCFFQGVTHVYDSMHETSALLDILVEFGACTLESVGLADTLADKIKKESRFIADVFCRLNLQRLQIPVQLPTKCSGCDQTIFEGGRHFTQVDWPGTIIRCSGCPAS